MSECVVNGVKIAWQQMGEGPDLVFVHGLAASRAFWFGQYALQLQDRYRITLFDLRAHGYSERAASGYSSTALSQDLEGLLDQIGVERCAVVGHSFGGGVALEFAARCPQRTRALCIMDTKINALQPTQKLSDMPHLTPFEVEVAQRSGIDWDSEQQIGLTFLEAVARLRVSEQAIPTRDVVTPFGEGRGAMRTARAWLDLIDTPGVREELLTAGAPGPQLAAQLRDTPTLLIYGGRSRCVPSCERLSALLPQAQVEVIADAGHFFPLSHAGFVRPRLESFLGAALA